MVGATPDYVKGGLRRSCRGSPVTAHLAVPQVGPSLGSVPRSGSPEHTLVRFRAPTARLGSGSRREGSERCTDCTHGS
jgi:hypothetical protein